MELQVHRAVGWALAPTRERVVLEGDELADEAREVVRTLTLDAARDLEQARQLLARVPTRSRLGALLGSPQNRR